MLPAYAQRCQLGMGLRGAVVGTGAPFIRVTPSFLKGTGWRGAARPAKPAMLCGQVAGIQAALWRTLADLFAQPHRSCVEGTALSRAAWLLCRHKVKAASWLALLRKPS